MLKVAALQVLFLIFPPLNAIIVQGVGGNRIISLHVGLCQCILACVLCGSYPVTSVLQFCSTPALHIIKVFVLHFLRELM